MNAIEEEPFKLYSIYYDLIYNSKNYELESSYIHSKLQHISGKDILELGSGTGNYASFLCKKGYVVTGLEKSRFMLEQSSEKKIEGFLPIIGDIVDFNLGKKFDSIMSLFHVISYLTTDKEIEACFRNVSRHLKQEGIFIFDVWYTPAVRSQKPESRVKQVENEFYKVIRHADPILNEDRNTVDVVYEIIVTETNTEQYHILKEIHTMRHFSTPEIEMFANLAELELINSEEFLTADPPSENTWGVCYTLQKK